MKMQKTIFNFITLQLQGGFVPRLQGKPQCLLGSLVLFTEKMNFKRFLCLVLS